MGKYITEIPDEVKRQVTASMTKEEWESVSAPWTIASAVALAIPYNDSRDFISLKALKTELLNDMWIDQDFAKAIIDTIENSHAFVARPQGEWKIREAKDNDGDLIGHELYCSNCGKVKVRFISRCYTAEEAEEQLKDQFANFCEDCGADMRGHDSLEGGGTN